MKEAAQLFMKVASVFQPRKWRGRDPAALLATRADPEPTIYMAGSCHLVDAHWPCGLHLIGQDSNVQFVIRVPMR